MSNNNPQVGTCSPSMISHHDTTLPHERNAACVDWLPNGTPAEPRTLTMNQLKKAVKQCQGDEQHSCYLGNRLAVHKIMGTAEPRIETAPMKDAAKEWNMESEQFGAQVSAEVWP